MGLLKVTETGMLTGTFVALIPGVRAVTTGEGLPNLP
jgi:hypothetical protein